MERLKNIGEWLIILAFIVVFTALLISYVNTHCLLTAVFTGSVLVGGIGYMITHVN